MEIVQQSKPKKSDFEPPEKMIFLSKNKEKKGTKEKTMETKERKKKGKEKKEKKAQRGYRPETAPKMCFFHMRA